MSILEMICEALEERGCTVSWYNDDHKAFISPPETHVWVKDAWVYYWWQPFSQDDPVTRRVDLNDPAFLELLQAAIADIYLTQL